MKKFIIFLIALLMCASVFGEVREVEAIKLAKVLEKNKRTDIVFGSSINLKGIVCDEAGNLEIPSIASDKIKIVAEFSTEALIERINYKNLPKYKVYFVLRDLNTKTYAVINILGIEFPFQYKKRLEKERIAEEKRLEEERIAEEKRLEKERIAEEKRLEEERIAEEKRLEEERIAEEKRLEAERVAEEKRQRNAKFLPIYEQHLAKAKQYEAEKRWCFALGAYYDAMGIDIEAKLKTDAYNNYNELRDVIASGNPGKGKFNAFTLHDEWKKLLIDAEKYGSSISKYSLEIGDLVQGNLDYQTKTASYSAEIDFDFSPRYVYTICIIEKGYSEAFKKDWASDLPHPDNWPTHSVSYKNDGIYNVDGALIFEIVNTNTWSKNYGHPMHYNAWGIFLDSRSLFDFKFNIIDKSGKEVVKGKRFLLEDEEKRITFDGITPEVMDLIDNGEVFINPVAVYLEYGQYNSADDKGGRSFIKKFSEVTLDINNAVFFGKNLKNEKHLNFLDTLFNKANLKLVEIPNKNYMMSTTEITIGLYESLVNSLVDSSNYHKNFDIPVRVSVYEAIYFCNKLSERMGFTPVYYIDGKTDTSSWDYHNSDFRTLKRNINANGFRLPTIEEWAYAAKGGEEFKYAESNNLDEVALHKGNSNDELQKSGLKKTNAYGLYDMTGNVKEILESSEISDNWGRLRLVRTITDTTMTDEEFLDLSSLIEIAK